MVEPASKSCFDIPQPWVVECKCQIERLRIAKFQCGECSAQSDLLPYLAFDGGGFPWPNVECDILSHNED